MKGKKANFEYFVIFAEMRTGSNALERHLNQLNGLAMYGEAFNPDFIGQPNWPELFDVTFEERQKTPEKLIENLRAEPRTLPGFRFFFDHEPRVVETLLSDPTCGKIVLLRNPLDSWVSLRLASVTDQWMLTDMADSKPAKINFNLDMFTEHFDQLQAFQQRIQQGLQQAGQTAFYLNYDDIGDVEVLNGVAQYLGLQDRLSSITSELKPQHPKPLSEKVRNFDEMIEMLRDFDRFDLYRTPNFEPRRPPAVPTYVTAVAAPLLYLPIPGGPTDQILQWLAAIDLATPGDLPGNRDQKTLRKWKREHPGFRSFAVLRHPVARIYDSFCDRILSTGPGSFLKIRAALQTQYDVPLPDDPDDPGFGPAETRAAFLDFLAVADGILKGQTNIRVDPAWATQTAILQGMAQIAVPDRLIREEALHAELTSLAQEVGVLAPELPKDRGMKRVPLDQIYDHEVELACRAVYQRDYLNYGWGAWQQV